MSKKLPIYFATLVVAIVLVWFFVQKFKDIPDNQNLNNNQSLDDLVNQKNETEDLVVPNQADENWLRLSSGLQILNVIVGSGQEAKEGYTVFAHYAGTLSDGRKFDSSYDRGQPFKFVLGSGMVIKGWDLGLVGMKVGGKRKLIIPPDLAYGDKEVGGGIIPANSTLYFEIELMDIQEQTSQ